MTEKILIITATCLLITLWLSSCNRHNANNKETTEKVDSIENASNIDLNKNSNYYLGDEIVYDTSVVISRQETPYRGELKYKYQWKDRNGINKVIISQMYDYKKGFGRAEVFAYQYLKNKDKWELVWQMNDFVDGLGCDLKIDIKKAQIIDIDSNYLAETLFLYTKDSRCDAVGVSTRLLLYVNAKKIAIRGISNQYLMPPEDVFNKVMDLEEGKYYKYKNIDAGVFPEDTIFVQYASKFWDDFIKNENEQYKKEMEAFEKRQQQELKSK